MQGRHPLQTSDSLRVGEVQVGPEALSMAAVLNKELGLSHERTARVLALGYGLKWSRSGVCRALERLGNLAAPTYQQLQKALRQSPVVWLDDTGWTIVFGRQECWVFQSIGFDPATRSARESAAAFSS